MKRGIKERLLESSEENIRSFSVKLKVSDNPETVIGVRTPVLRKLAGSLKDEYSSFGALHEEMAELLPLYFEAKMAYVFAAVKMCRSEEEWLLFFKTILAHLDGWAVCDAVLSDVGKVLKKDVVRKAFESCFSLREGLPLYGIRVFLTIRMYYHKHGLENLDDILADINATKPFWNHLTIRQAVSWALATISIEEFEGILSKWYMPILRNGDRTEEEDLTIKLYKQKMKESRRIPREWCERL